MEEVQQKGNLNQTAEQLSIFINKNAGEYNNATMPATDDKRMTKKLELTIVQLNEKLSKLKVELEKKCDEIIKLKNSVDNHIFINEKLNKAYKKSLKKGGKAGIEDQQDVIKQKDSATGG